MYDPFSKKEAFFLYFPVTKTKLTHVLILFFAGICAGFVNALLGTGGGIILVYTLSALMPDTVQDHFVTSLAVTLLLSVWTLLSYCRTITFEAPMLFLLILPGILGGSTGAWLLPKIRIPLLQRTFALLTIYAGIRMLLP